MLKKSGSVARWAVRRASRVAASASAALAQTITSPKARQPSEPLPGVTSPGPAISRASRARTVKVTG